MESKSLEESKMRENFDQLNFEGEHDIKKSLVNRN
jgi:hypothetical protein